MFITKNMPCEEEQEGHGVQALEQMLEENQKV